MLQHFNLEIFTYNVKTTSLFKTAPLKVSALSSEFILALFRHQRSSHTSWHLPSCIVWCSLSYRDTGGRQHCPAAPWQYEVRQGRSWEQTHKKKKEKPNNHMTAWLLHPEGTWRANNTESLCDHRDQRVQRSIHLRPMEAAHARLRGGGGGVPFRTIELQT